MIVIPLSQSEILKTGESSGDTRATHTTISFIPSKTRV